MKKLYWLCWILFACVVYLTPTHQSYAYFPRGYVNQNIFACGVSTNNWCVGGDSYTVFTASTGTATCTGTSNLFATCGFFVDNTVQASLSGSSVNGNTLTVGTVNSGTIAVNQTIVDANMPAGRYITAGSGLSWTFSGASISGPVALAAPTTITGNDTLCAGQAIGGLLSSALSTFSPTVQPCATQAHASSLVRSRTTPDWLLVKKGTTWTEQIGAPAGGNWNPIGGSYAAPYLIAAYGTGARPDFVKQQGSVDYYCFSPGATRGQFLAIIGMECNGAVYDPNSPLYDSYTLSADTGSANCVLTTTICNISAVPAAVQANPTNYYAYGNGINAIALTSSGTTSTTIGLASAPGQITTGGTGQMTVQITTKAGKNGITLGDVGLLIIEDVWFHYSALGATQTVSPPATFPYQASTVRVRRNIHDHDWTNGIVAGSDCMFFTNFSLTSTFLFQEEVCSYGGWDPVAWGAPGLAGTHNFYYHDPAGPFNNDSNTNAFASSDNQWRPGGTDHNSLYFYNGEALLTGIEYNQVLVDYDVIADPTDQTLGLRSPTQAVPCTTGTCGTVLAMSGIGAWAGINMVGSNGISIANLSNPGSLSGNITSLAGPNTVNLSTAVTPGIRGDGIQLGDVIRLYGGENGAGIYAVQAGIFISEPPSTTAGSYNYPIGSTVAIANTSGGAYTVTDPTSRFMGIGGGGALPILSDEPFQFTSGSVPTDVALNTTYCSSNATWPTTTYNFYPATAGGSGTNLCPGASSNLVSASGSNSGSGVRTGARAISFATASVANYPWTGVPTSVVPGMVACGYDSNNTYFSATPVAGATGCTTVFYITPDNETVITNDPVTSAMPSIQQATMLFGIPNSSVIPSGAVIQIGPNNVFTNGQAQGATGGANFAITFATLTSGLSATGNYVHNWNHSATTNDLQNNGFAGTNTLTAAGQVLDTANSCTTGCSGITLPATATQAYPEYYDAINRSGNSLTGYIAPNGHGGETLTIVSGTAPSGPTLNTIAGDMLFDTAGATIIGENTKVASCSGSTCTLICPAAGCQTIGSSGSPISMMFGSVNHILQMMNAQSHDAGWNTTWSAIAINNFIRTALATGNQTNYPGSPASPAQGYLFNFLLKRDVDPASNDNDPMWLGKAA